MRQLTNPNEASGELNRLIAAAVTGCKVETRDNYPGDEGDALAAWSQGASALSMRLTRQEMEPWRKQCLTAETPITRIHAVKTIPLPRHRSYLAWEIYAVYPCLKDTEKIYLTRWVRQLEEIGDFWLLTFENNRSVLFQWYYGADGLIERAEVYSSDSPADQKIVQHRQQLWRQLEATAIKLEF